MRRATDPIEKLFDNFFMSAAFVGTCINCCVLVLVHWLAAIAQLDTLPGDCDEPEIGVSVVLVDTQSVDTSHWHKPPKNNLKLKDECVLDFCRQLSRAGDSIAGGSAQRGGEN